jgi:asparagine synthase (glutamine-hydrolysing)
MCGIAGIVNGGDEATLRRMADVLAHRGPDDAGIQWFPRDHCGIAHRRLAILDLSAAGHQPMANHSGDRWITYNGEVYNFRELRKELNARGHQFHTSCDTEVILAAYDEWGVECVRRFNGMFAFAIYDVRSRELFIARDHLGIKPFYYAVNGEMFAFASESKALFEVDTIKRQVDPDAVVSTALRLWVPEPITGHLGIRKLPAGHYGKFRNGKLQIHEYWDVPVPSSNNELAEKPEGELIEELRHLLEQAIRRQMVADVPVGALLSGGLDSSLIVALMRRLNPASRISTYTIAFSQKDMMMESMPDDAVYARRVAELFGTEHHEIEVSPDIDDLLPKILWHLDDPIADGAAINTYLISRAARDHGTIVLLNGMGADEVFAGYRRHLSVLTSEHYRRLPRVLRKGIIEPIIRSMPVAISGRGLRLFRWARLFLESTHDRSIDTYISGFTFLAREEIQKAINMPALTVEEWNALYPIRCYYDLLPKVAGQPIVEQMTYMDTKLFLPGLNLLYSDKASMAASVELRPPLIDVDLVEFAARLPTKYKIRGRIQKYLLKKAAEAYLPKEIIYRPKAPFATPLRSWMRGGLRDRVSALFETSGAAHNRYLKPEYVQSLLKAHRSGRADNAHLLWGLYVLAKWLDQNVDREETPSSMAVGGKI